MEGKEELYQELEELFGKELEIKSKKEVLRETQEKINLKASAFARYIYPKVINKFISECGISSLKIKALSSEEILQIARERYFTGYRVGFKELYEYFNGESEVFSKVRYRVKVIKPIAKSLKEALHNLEIPLDFEEKKLRFKKYILLTFCSGNGCRHQDYPSEG